jgi:fibro-slime domain-containing protein
VTKKWIGHKYPEQYGPQTLSIYCPPYNYKYANSQVDTWGQNTFALCQSWLYYGGPRAVNSAGSEKSAAIWAASENGTLGLQHLRNYGFTMMGYAQFKYRASNQVPTPEVFEVAGDDDMWIFVDGVLVVDLGGTHEPAPGKVDISVLAKYNHGCHVGEPLATFSNCSGASDATGWADDSWHHLHIFYADRQSDGSNIYIRSSLAEIAPSRYGQPVIKDFVTKVDKKGNAFNHMFLNNPLDDASLASIRSSAAPSLLVMRDVNVNGKMQTVVNGFYVRAIEGPVDKGTDGVKYVFEGVLLDAAGNAIDGGLLADDRIAFNVPYCESLEYDGNRGNFSNDVWNQIMYWSKLMNFYVTSAFGLQVERFDGKEWWAKVRYVSVSGDGSEIEYCED